MIDEKTSVIGDWGSIIKRLKESKHLCLYIRLEYPVGYMFIK